MSSRPPRGAARLAAILDALPDALVLVNANGTVVNANAIALEAFEAPGTALVGRGLLDLLPEFDSKLIPGSMRRPDHVDPRARTRPTRMIARRTDGSEFPVEVTSANLENGQQAYDGYGYAADELLMLVVRDLTGTIDTEAELARSQRQTEMILRAASEGVVGTDTDGRIVLVNPAAAQTLGYRASDLGGKELHTLVLHSRADGSPFPYDESPLADTLRSGRKHRVRGQVLWSKAGDKVSVDLTTAPVRDGDQLVGAVMTFTDRRPYDALAEEKAAVEAAHAEELERLSEEHAADLTALRQQHVAELEELREGHAEELAAGEDRYAALAEREKDRYEALAARHEQLLTLLGGSLRGPLDELRRELAALAADDAGQLWPEANQVLHHLSAGYSRITTLIDNVLGYQRLDAGDGQIARTKVMLDSVVAAGVDGAVELIGPGRVQFAVHAPPIEAEVEPALLATALAHLVADVAGVDATGNAPVSAGGYMDNTVVVAAAQRGEVVRIEVRGPYAGGDPVHEPIVRGIVRAHGGVLQTHEVPGMSGNAYVLEVPIGSGAGAVAAEAARLPALEAPAEAGQTSGGRRRARRGSTDAFLDGEIHGEAPGQAPGEVPGVADGVDAESGVPTGRRRRRAAAAAEDVPQAQVPAAPEAAEAPGGSGTGRRRGRPAEPAGGDPADGTVGAGVALPQAAEAVNGVAEGSVVTADEHAAGTAAVGTGLGGTVPPQGMPAPTGRRARRAADQNALPPALPSAPSAEPAESAALELAAGPQPTGRRRRALAAAQERANAQEAAPRTVFALPPVDTGADPGPAAERPAEDTDGHGGQPLPAPAPAPGAAPAPAQVPAQGHGPAAVPLPGQTPAPAPVPAQGLPGAVPSDDHAGRHDAVPHAQSADHTPPQPHPTTQPTGRRRRAVAQPPVEGAGTPAQGVPVQQPDTMTGQAGVPAQATHGQGVPAAPAAPGTPTPPQGTHAPHGTHGHGTPLAPAQPLPAQGIQGTHGHGVQPAPARTVPAQAQPLPAAAPLPAEAPATPAAGTPTPAAPLPPARETPGTPATGTPTPTTWPPGAPAAQPLPLPAEASAPVDPNSTQGRAISVRTLGQGVPFTRQAEQVQQAQPLPTATPAPHQPGGSGRRRKLGTPPDPTVVRQENVRPEQSVRSEPSARPHPQGAQAPGGQPLPGANASEGAGRSYAIGAPDENAAEGPEPLDGPGGAVEVADTPRPQPLDDELPPEPLDNPRRLLVWPAPDVSTQQALSDRGYRPVIVHSREEVDAQIAAFPAALFVDPLTGPITRTALQSLRQAAVAAEVPVMVTAGLGQATREAAYGADPAVLLKALAPRDSEQHPPRVLLIEEHAEIALALTATLERRGMQVARAASDADAVALAGQFRPNLVVMDLMQVHRHQAGIVDWLRANGQLNRTPLVVYTAAVDPADLPRLASGETVLFLAERSTSGEVQARIVDLLARIGTN
ncbi:PAS domain-containing protein [Streptomyces sp. NPDC053367]|uniref:PAS domain-containing protein n=1 Tax=Streptomyces sp. NPDC053367 TaxID=3365700 RepID=UPI0037CEF1EC